MSEKKKPEVKKLTPELRERHAAASKAEADAHRVAQTGDPAARQVHFAAQVELHAVNQEVRKALAQ